MRTPGIIGIALVALGQVFARDTLAHADARASTADGAPGEENG